MKEYLILTRQPSSLNLSATVFQPYYLKKHTFKTYEEALEFAGTLNFGVTIYESIAETEINHTVTRLKNAPK